MLTAPAAAAHSPALSTRLSCSKIATQARSMPRHSHMPAGTVQQQDTALLPVLPIPGSRGELLWELEIRGAWAASKRIRAASHLAQWALLRIP